MKRYRVGIVGLGRMGSTIDDEGHTDQPYSIAAACRASERLKVVAGADLRAERREAFGERWGVPALYADYRRMVAQEAPDLVAVCTTASGLAKPASEAPDAGFRSDSHAELTVALAEAGVPMLYVEKAMASSAQMADAARAACERHGTLFNTGVLRRFDNRYQALREAVAAGVIGAPRAAVHFAATNLMHGHVHSIDTLSYLLGDPPLEAVRGELLPRDQRIAGNHVPRDPNATFQLRFAGGVEAWSVPEGEWEFEVLGTKGSIRSLNNGAGVTLRRTTGAELRRTTGAELRRTTGAELRRTTGAELRRTEEPFTLPEPVSPVIACLEDLVEAGESGGPTLSPVDLSARMVEACIAVAESHRRGGAWVELPLTQRDLYIFHV